jgi:SAM-dependent methyltransferase
LAFDPSEGHLRVARERLRSKAKDASVEVIFFVADFDTLMVRDNSFDISFCLNVLEYLDDIGPVVQKLARATKLGGRLVFKDEDAYRDILLSWRAELELPVTTAWFDILRSRKSRWNPEFGRELGCRLADVGLPQVDLQLIVHDHGSLLSRSQEDYIRAGFGNYVKEFGARMPPELFREFCRGLAIGEYVDDEPLLLRRPGFRFHSLEYVAVVTNQ